MSLEITGRLHKKYDAVDVSAKFKKREFVVELSEEISGNTYINYAAMQLVNNKCGIIDQFQEGDMVKVNFNIRGSKWTKDGKERYFSNLDAWRVERFDGVATGSSQQYAQPAQSNYGNQPAQNNYSGASQFNNNSSTEANDDLPF
jgi:Domain of unknown function (DUF3127)